MMDFVSYIAKDDVGRRMCYVFYCSGGCSREFIACIGEAFKRGYRVSMCVCVCRQFFFKENIKRKG